MTPNIIAIDGPAASGKSTIGKRLADELGYLFFDTGVMYRAVTWAALTRGVPMGDERALTALAQQLDIDVLPPTANDGRQYTVTADGVDVTWTIRTPQVDAAVSTVSAHLGVRAALVPQQRRVAARGPVVMVGRDIGTVVLPDAQLKVYLDASVEERARRRWEEMRRRGEHAEYGDVLAAMRRRDELDSNRGVSPLRAAADAIIVDTTHLDIEQVVERLERLVEAQQGAAESDADQGG